MLEFEEIFQVFADKCRVPIENRNKYCLSSEKSAFTNEGSIGVRQLLYVADHYCSMKQQYTVNYRNKDEAQTRDTKPSGMLQCMHEQLSY